jgi:hypothetical protein
VIEINQDNAKQGVSSQMSNTKKHINLQDREDCAVFQEQNNAEILTSSQLHQNSPGT